MCSLQKQTLKDKKLAKNNLLNPYPFYSIDLFLSLLTKFRENIIQKSILNENFVETIFSSFKKICNESYVVDDDGCNYSLLIQGPWHACKKSKLVIQIQC